MSMIAYTTSKTQWRAIVASPCVQGLLDHDAACSQEWVQRTPNGSLSRSRSHTNPAVPRMPAWAPVHGSNVEPHRNRRRDSAFSQLFTFCSLVVNSPSGLIATALLSPSLPLSPCHSLCHPLCRHQFTASNCLCLSLRPAPRVAPPLQSNTAAITGLPVGWGNKSPSPIAFYACVRACKIDPGCSNWNTCINALF